MEPSGVVGFNKPSRCSWCQLAWEPQPEKSDLGVCKLLPAQDRRAMKEESRSLSYAVTWGLWTDTKESPRASGEDPVLIQSRSFPMVLRGMPLCLAPHGLWPTRLLCPWDSPGKNIWVGSQSLLQGIFPTQGSNPGLLHCRQILYRLSHQGSLWRMCYLINPSMGSGNKTDVCNSSFFNYWPWVFTPRVLVFLSVGMGNIDLSGWGGGLWEPASSWKEQW